MNILFSVSCETKTRGLDALLRVLGERRAKALVAVLDSPMCEITVKLAHLWNMPLFTWTCPLVSKLNTHTHTEYTYEYIRAFVRTHIHVCNCSSLRTMNFSFATFCVLCTYVQCLMYSNVCCCLYVVCMSE